MGEEVKKAYLQLEAATAALEALAMGASAESVRVAMDRVWRALSDDEHRELDARDALPENAGRHAAPGPTFTPTERLEALVRLGLEAWARWNATRSPVPLGAGARADFTRELKERMAQGAQAWTAEVDTARDEPVPLRSTPLRSTSPLMGITEMVPHYPSHEEPKWRKPCPPSVVLFATDGRGGAVIIDHQGPDVRYLLDVDERAFVQDELQDWAFPGLWIWEGRVRATCSYEGEHDEWVDATIRPLTEDEARAVRDDDHVWDGALWIEDWKP